MNDTCNQLTGKFLMKFGEDTSRKWCRGEIIYKSSYCGILSKFGMNVTECEIDSEIFVLLENYCDKATFCHGPLKSESEENNFKVISYIMLAILILLNGCYLYRFKDTRNFRVSEDSRNEELETFLEKKILPKCFGEKSSIIKIIKYIRAFFGRYIVFIMDIFDFSIDVYYFVSIILSLSLFQNEAYISKWVFGILILSILKMPLVMYKDWHAVMKADNCFCFQSHDTAEDMIDIKKIDLTLTFFLEDGPMMFIQVFYWPLSK